MIDRLIVRYGLPTVAIAALIFAGLAFIGGKIAWKNIVIAWQASKIEKLEAQRDYAIKAADNANKDREQAERSASFSAEARDNTEAWLAFEKAQTERATEVIRERIREVPVVVPVPSDPAVMQVATDAYARALAAADRLPRESARR